MSLPNNVIEALLDKQKIKAIKLLRKQRGIGLKEAKELVDQYLSHGEKESSIKANVTADKEMKRDKKGLLLGGMVIVTFVWAMINLVEVVGSIIVLWHHDSYRQTTFIIEKVHYNDDHEAGLTWGFIGRLADGGEEVRMYAPRLADARALGHSKLRRMYPTGMRMEVWYNPNVTDTLFQHRTLRIIPYTPDLVNSEWAVIYRWLIYCLLPFTSTLMIAHAIKA